MSGPLLTEDEAGQKWCPFARLGVYAGPSAVAINRHPLAEIMDGCTCMTSDCMAWRWEGATPSRQRATHVAEIHDWTQANPMPPYGWRWSYVWAEGDPEPEERQTARLAWEEWAEKARAFLATLTKPEVPPDTMDGTWEWSAGLDEDDGSIFAGWVAQGGVLRGYCGLAGSPVS